MHSVSCIYMYMTKNGFAIRFWFKVNCCLICMSYDGLEYLQINTWAFPYWPGYHPETPIWVEG